MTHGKPRDERKEQQWRRLLSEWQASGFSISVFCARRRLPAASFYAWRRELKRRDAQRAAFVPVHVLADATAPRGDSLELVLAGGRTVRVPPSFDAATLRRLLSVLEEQPC
jgi:transposase